MKILTKTIPLIIIINLVAISVFVLTSQKESTDIEPIFLFTNQNNTTYNNTNLTIDEPPTQINGNWTDWSPLWDFIYEKEKKESK